VAVSRGALRVGDAVEAAINAEARTATEAHHTATHLLQAALQETLGQPFVVANRAGAGGLLAAGAVARAKNDGYTLLLTTNSTHSVVYGCSRTCPTTRSRISRRSRGSAAFPRSSP
jgi:hypothetical protein